MKKRKKRGGSYCEKNEAAGDNFIIYSFFTLKRYVCYEAIFA